MLQAQVSMPLRKAMHTAFLFVSFLFLALTVSTSATAQEQQSIADTESILQTALDQGIDLPYSCQSGLCTACRGKALSGTVKLDEEEGLSQSERAEGYVLTCVGHPLTDDVVIEIG